MAWYSIISAWLKQNRESGLNRKSLIMKWGRFSVQNKLDSIKGCWTQYVVEWSIAASYSEQWSCHGIQLMTRITKLKNTILLEKSKAIDIFVSSKHQFQLYARAKRRQYFMQVVLNGAHFCACAYRKWPLLFVMINSRSARNLSRHYENQSETRPGNNPGMHRNRLSHGNLFHGATASPRPNDRPPDSGGRRQGGRQQSTPADHTFY